MPVYGRNTWDGGVVLPDAVKHDLQLHDLRPTRAAAQGRSAVGGGVAAHGRVADNLDILAVIAAENFHGAQPLLCKLL